jgi:two-component system, sensor histidine kinase
MESELTGDILAVDDNPANLLAIESSLGELAGRLVRAQSGGEALRILLGHDFALILLDVKMPSMDGFETARMIRQRKRSRHTPIIFITAYGRDDKDVLAAYALGAVDFLFKPIVPEVLRAKASVFVELQRREYEMARQAELLREAERREHERDLEEQRRSWNEESMRQRMEELAEADRRKDEFLAMLGHELRNPLAPIMFGLDLLKAREAVNGEPDPEFMKVHTRMRRQLGHLTRLVDDLLDLSRINTGIVELKRAPVAIQDVIEQALVTSRPLLDECDHQLTVSAPTEPIMLSCDPVRLTQVVSNLLNNAARYTDRGGIIRLECRKLPDAVELRVVDSGRGIAPELLPHVFDMFVQEQRGNGGLGLGLTLVQRLVTLHDGSVSAHSEGVGKGSEFVVRLPLPATPLPASSPPEPAPRETSATEPAKGLHVVLVEDNDDIRETTTELLTVLGHQVESAADGEAGAELILRTEPDVALVDLGLPLLDGHGVASRVRARLGPERVKLVAMSGYGRESDRRRAQEAGFDAHLVKPVALETLMNVLPTRNANAKDRSQ